MKNLITIFLLLITSSLFSQTHDTIWFDDKWKKCTKEDAVYYRISTYNKESNNYSVVDYYKSGRIQMTGTFISIDPEIKDGIFLWYLEDGSVSKKAEYKNNAFITRDKNGVEIQRFKGKFPEFPGGTTALLKYLQKELKYPTKAVNQGIQGRVLVKFKIDENGKVDSIQVIKSVHPLLDKEAIRVVKSLPKFIPAELDGTIIPFYYSLPIDFNIPKD